MNDCGNANIRDSLPDLLYDRLEQNARATLMAHVAGCSDCAEELDLLRRLHVTLRAPARRLDERAIVSALPKPPGQVVRIASRRSRRLDWRIAAGVGFLAVAGSSIAVLHHPVPAAQTASSVVAPIAALDSPTPAPARAGETVVAADAQAAADVAPGGRLANLNEQQLQTLLGEIDQLPAIPVTEPEPVTIGVSGSAPSTPDGT
jgi:anti-sigma factor RsiW